MSKYLNAKANAGPSELGEGGGGTVETCAHPMIFSDPNVPFFKSRIYEFSEPHSFWSRKLLTSTNHDFSVSGLLKIKFICSVCFHWFWPKILAFRPLTSYLSPFFVVWGHVINHSKRNFASSPLHRKDISCHRWKENLFILEWPQDFPERTFCVVFEIWLFQHNLFHHGST